MSGLGVYNVRTIDDCGNGVVYSVDVKKISPPNVNVIAPDCLHDGMATIYGYSSLMTYQFSPLGPSVDSVGGIKNINFNQSYDVVADIISCASDPSSFIVHEKVTPPQKPIIVVTAPDCNNDGYAQISNYVSSGITYTASSGITISETGKITGTGGVFTVTASNGACDSTSLGFSIAPKLAKPTVSITGISSICANDNTTLTATGTPNSGTYIWDNGVTTNAITVDPSADMLYKVTYTANGCDVKDSVMVTVNANIIPTFTNPGPICQGDVLILPTSNNGVAGTWDKSANNDTTTTYLFTPNTGVCADTASLTIVVNPKPVLTAQNVSICTGETIDIALNSNFNGTIFDWTTSANNVQGASNGTGNIINQTLASQAGGTVTYNVTPILGQCQGVPINVVVTVNALPTVSVASSAIEICAGDSITLNVSGASSYSWTSTAGSCTSVGSTITESPLTTTTYTVKGTASTGCSNTAHTQITVLPKPTLTVSDDISICFGQTANLNVSGADSYSWLPSNSINNSMSSDVAASPTLTTTYTVVGFDSYGCSAIDCVKVTVNPLPNISVGQNQTVCAESVILLQGSGAQSYIWDNGVVDGQPFVIDSTTTFTVIGTSAFGCSNTAQVKISTISVPVVEFEPDTNLSCSPAHIQFNNQTTGAVSYEWDFGDGTSTTTTNPLHGYNQDGCYDVTLIAYASNSCSTKVVKSNVVCLLPSPTAAFIADRDEVTNLMNTVNFLNQSQNADSYQWFFGNETVYSTEEVISYTYDPSLVGNHQVTLVATNSDGCTDTAQAIISMEQEVVFYVPNAFTPNGDEYNNVFKPVVASGIDVNEFSMTVFDRWGEIVFETHDINVGWDGVYLFTGEFVQDGIYVWKIDAKVLGMGNRFSKTGNVTILR